MPRVRPPKLALAATLPLALGFAFLSCSEQLPRPDPAPDPGVETGPDARPLDAGADAALARGDRTLGIGLDLRRLSFASDVEQIRDGGARATTVGYAWDEVERPYDAGDGDATTHIYEPGFHVANLVLAAYGTQAVLSVEALDVAGPRLPEDLSGSDLASEDVAARFDRVTDYAMAQTRDLDVAAYVVASDVDGAFGDDADQWAAFATFFARVAAHARAVRPGLAVGVAVSAGGAAARRAELAPIWGASDVAVLTLVGVDAAARAVAPEDAAAVLEQAVAAVPEGLPVVVRALAYPSAPECGSDEAAQAAFVSSVFAAWDRHAGRMPLVVFAPLHEHPESEVSALSARHGRSDPTFLAMLRSLGLHRSGGAAKPALETLTTEARARGF
jgi:hypothetical protein